MSLDPDNDDGYRAERNRPERRNPGYKRPTVPGGRQLSEAQEKAVMNLHRQIRAMGYEFSFEDCKQAMKETNFDQQLAAQNILDGNFKPWKTANRDRQYGDHRHKRQQYVEIKFFNDSGIKQQIKEGVENYDIKIDGEVPETDPKDTETHVEYVETEAELKERQEKAAAKREKNEAKRKEKLAKKQAEKEVAQEKPIKEVVEGAYTVVTEQPIEKIELKPAQPVVITPVKEEPIAEKKPEPKLEMSKVVVQDIEPAKMEQQPVVKQAEKVESYQPPAAKHQAKAQEIEAPAPVEKKEEQTQQPMPAQQAQFYYPYQYMMPPMQPGQMPMPMQQGQQMPPMPPFPYMMPFMMPPMQPPMQPGQVMPQGMMPFMPMPMPQGMPQMPHGMPQMPHGMPQMPQGMAPQFYQPGYARQGKQ